MQRMSLLVASLLAWTPTAAAEAQAGDPGPVYLVSIPYPSLRGLARDSVRIARVRITARMPVSIPMVTGRPSSVACGYSYRATVVESLKGGDQPFEFFSSVIADFQGLDRDYLVFVKERTLSADRQAVASIIDSLSDGERRELLCRNSEKYYTPAPYQAMRAFDLDAAQLFGGEWLAPVNRIDLPWCLIVDERVPQGDWNGREKKPGDRSTEVLSWDSAKKLIARALQSGGSDRC
jgi:hypothetical protein